jgi:uncharacterized alkaline shock family protein YloU
MNVSAPAEAADRQALTAPAAREPSDSVAETSRSARAQGAAERGRTTVSRQAVEAVTARLAADCPDVEGPDAGEAARRLPGLHATLHRDDPVVAARLHSATAVSLAVRCSVRYPRPVARTAERLRELLMTRVSELTGMRVQRVDITVTGLPSAAHGRRVE